MKHRITKKHIGRPIEFRAFDGNTYYGTLINVFRRGIFISYYVPSVMRECQSSVLKTDAKERIHVY